jgi:methylenetetrahydrofolate dehydrogenase (NADP+)/methenyltetrahydrofolate cyclohydrolase
MTAQILSGKHLAAEIEQALKAKIAVQTSLGHRAPKLAVVLVGENSASQIYVRRKQEMCQRIGIISTKHHLPEAVSEKELLDLIQQLNHDTHTDGILVQMPLPEHLQRENIKEKIIEQINPHKDVDGFHPYNLGRLAQGHPLLRPCTPYGIIRLLQHNNIAIKSLEAVVVGASTIVGRPLALELLLAGATVTICHSKTRNLKKHINSAELLISATGRRNLIPSNWIKKDSIIIDVGIHRLDDGTLCGDLDFESASQQASYITPVPGGVGPMTVAMLMENTYRAYLSALNLENQL